MTERRAYDSLVADFIRSFEEAKRTADILYDAAVSAGATFRSSSSSRDVFGTSADRIRGNTLLELHIEISCAGGELILRDVEVEPSRTRHDHAAIHVHRSNLSDTWELFRTFRVSDPTILLAPALAVGLVTRERREIKTDKRIREIVASLAKFYLDP